MAKSNNAEKIVIISSCHARDLNEVLTPNSYAPSWPRDMVINNRKPHKGENEKLMWTNGEHGQDDFNAAVNLEGGNSGGSYCTIM